jgi:hypothetical protein
VVGHYSLPLPESGKLGAFCFSPARRTIATAVFALSQGYFVAFLPQSPPYRQRRLFQDEVHGRAAGNRGLNLYAGSGIKLAAELKSGTLK